MPRPRMVRLHPLPRPHHHSQNKLEDSNKGSNPVSGLLPLFVTQRVTYANSYLCGDKLFLLHNLFNLASERPGNTFTILRIALVEVTDLQVLNTLLNLPQSSSDVPAQPFLRIRFHQPE
jgi:hypothetical protein